jgi:hypothetical protein
MTVSITAPKFKQGQEVSFVGGLGTIKECHFESGTWTYLIEMAMGPEPAIGRIGSETRVLLTEADITSLPKLSDLFSCLSSKEFFHPSYFQPSISMAQ